MTENSEFNLHKESLVIKKKINVDHEISRARVGGMWSMWCSHSWGTEDMSKGIAASMTRCFQWQNHFSFRLLNPTWSLRDPSINEHLLYKYLYVTSDSCTVGETLHFNEINIWLASEVWHQSKPCCTIDDTISDSLSYLSFSPTCPSGSLLQHYSGRRRPCPLCPCFKHASSLSCWFLPVSTERRVLT